LSLRGIIWEQMATAGLIIMVPPFVLTSNDPYRMPRDPQPLYAGNHDGDRQVRQAK